MQVSRGSEVHTNTHTHGLSIGGLPGQQWVMTGSPQTWQQVSAVSKKPILKASPKSQQIGVIESNLKLGWDWPSRTRINDNVQWEKALKKWDNNVLCLVILLTKLCYISGSHPRGYWEREEEKGGYEIETWCPLTHCLKKKIKKSKESTMFKQIIIQIPQHLGERGRQKWCCNAFPIHIF